jgi:hypothetical protein
LAAVKPLGPTPEIKGRIELTTYLKSSKLYPLSAERALTVRMSASTMPTMERHTKHDIHGFGGATESMNVARCARRERETIDDTNVHSYSSNRWVYLIGREVSKIYQPKVSSDTKRRPI